MNLGPSEQKRRDLKYDATDVLQILRVPIRKKGKKGDSQKIR